jgi:hypothetical protein
MTGHPGLFFEMTAEGELMVMPPTYSETGARNDRIARQLAFVLPNGAEIQSNINSITGDGPVVGFVLNPSFVWNPVGI